MEVVQSLLYILDETAVAIGKHSCVCVLNNQTIKHRLETPSAVHATGKVIKPLGTNIVDVNSMPQVRVSSERKSLVILRVIHNIMQMLGNAKLYMLLKIQNVSRV